MLDTVKPLTTALWIVHDPFGGKSVDAEGSTQAGSFQYIVVCNTKSRSTGTFDRIYGRNSKE